MIKTKKDGTVIIGGNSILFRLFNLGYTFKFDNKAAAVYVRNDYDNKIIRIPLKNIEEVSYTLKYGNIVISSRQEGKKRLQDILFSLKNLTKEDTDFLVKFFVSADKKVINTDERNTKKSAKGTMI